MNPNTRHSCLNSILRLSVTRLFLCSRLPDHNHTHQVRSQLSSSLIQCLLTYLVSADSVQFTNLLLSNLLIFGHTLW
uniref:Uncharacterized protein n=1 Tax=Brassica oleracea var. oleracea TaxID=109376 RepID=A0A0D2ZS39_BRAOL